MEPSMKGTVDVREISPAVISDGGKLRLGSMSPALPPVRVAATKSETAKVRIGSVSPAFPPVRAG
jgi:hypothetical protein